MTVGGMGFIPERLLMMMMTVIIIYDQLTRHWEPYAILQAELLRILCLGIRSAPLRVKACSPFPCAGHLAHLDGRTEACRPYHTRQLENRMLLCFLGRRAHVVVLGV